MIKSVYQYPKNFNDFVKSNSNDQPSNCDLKNFREKSSFVYVFDFSEKFTLSSISLTYLDKSSCVRVGVPLALLPDLVEATVRPLDSLPNCPSLVKVPAILVFTE